ncbi:Fic family protein [Castellaniella sp.]|uniref:Fic family protein n=1 Tax=Castellaniella sp. TaxID=1955812 RepID=UPI002AFE1BCB|nr:Fic family protein [Castellaniella sp.]
MTSCSFQALLESIRSAPDGLAISALLDLHPGLTRRTAQRWLRNGVAQGRLQAVGAGRGRRYRAMTCAGSAGDAASVTIVWAHEPSPDDASDIFPVEIPLSVDSQDILAYVNRPLAGRHPVGYQRDFLDAYEPGRTWYLPEPLRQQLRRMGDTGQMRRPAGTYGRAILGRLLIDLSWASSHLEGNTYTRLDTRELIRHGRIAGGKAAQETQMILNHKSAIELLVENADTAGFDRFTLFNLHSALSENLLLDKEDEGRLRLHMVDIGQSVYRPLGMSAQIGEMLDILLDKAGRIPDPFEQSFFVMVHLPYLQPFADVNKRTSRLAANLPLIRANLCPLTFLGVPESAYVRAILGVYEMTRVELLRDLYVWAYARSAREYLAIRRGLAEPDPWRLAWRGELRQVVRDVVLQSDRAPLEVIDETLSRHDLGADHENVRALVIEELRHLHEGVLARYGLRPADYERWRAHQLRLT